jgi:uncharacterized membrane protein (DUF373 family)
MFEEKLIVALTRFNRLLHVALAIALVVGSAMVIWEFSLEVSHSILHNHLITGFLQAMGTLFLVWTLSSLISAEISYLQDGVLQVRVFIEVAIITLLRQIITKPVMLATGRGNADDLFDPMQYSLILAALLVAGILHWLVGNASISVQQKPN